jgi:hypothetical protein
MDDSYANPMRTGLMFVPLGPTAGFGGASALRDRDHLAKLRADMEPDGYETMMAPSAESGWSFRQLIGLIANIVRPRVAWRSPETRPLGLRSSTRFR